MGVARQRDSPMHSSCCRLHTYLDQIPRNSHNFRLSYKFGARPPSDWCLPLFAMLATTEWIASCHRQNRIENFLDSRFRYWRCNLPNTAKRPSAALDNIISRFYTLIWMCSFCCEFKTSANRASPPQLASYFSIYSNFVMLKNVPMLEMDLIKAFWRHTVRARSTLTKRMPFSRCIFTISSSKFAIDAACLTSFYTTASKRRKIGRRIPNGHQMKEK